jgi:hypothetical protein
LEGRKGVSAAGALPQGLQQCIGRLEIGCVKPLGKPMVDWRKEILGFLTFSLLLPESSKTDGGS